MDYRSYHTKWVEKLIILMLSTGITLLMSFLFYDSKWGMLGLIPVVLIVSKIWKRQRKEKRNRQLKKEFMDFIQILSTFLSTGSSLENAMVKAEPEMKKQYGNESLMYQEIIAMNKEVQLRKPVEKVLLEFGQKTAEKGIAGVWLWFIDYFGNRHIDASTNYCFWYSDTHRQQYVAFDTSEQITSQGFSHYRHHRQFYFISDNKKCK